MEQPPNNDSVDMDNKLNCFKLDRRHGQESSNSGTKGVSFPPVDRNIELPIRPSRPITKQEALELYRSHLSPHQRTEIIRYRPLDTENRNDLFFIGLGAQSPTYNNLSDYGDASGRYRFIAHDHLSWRYEMLQVLPFDHGRLFRALDHREGEYVVIKPLAMRKTPPYDCLDMDMAVYDELRDVHDACPPDSLPFVQPIHTFSFRRHDFIVFPAYKLTLSEYLDGMRGQPMDEGVIRQVAQCLIDSLRLLNKKELVLGDLSADNIAIKDGNVMRAQVIDCGRAIYPFMGACRRKDYRLSVTSAPEVVKGDAFESPADLYSLGKLLAAMSVGPETCRQKSESLLVEQYRDGSLRHFIEGCTHPNPAARWSLRKVTCDSWVGRDGWVPLSLNIPWLGRIERSTTGCFVIWAIGWALADTADNDDIKDLLSFAHIAIFSVLRLTSMAVCPRWYNLVFMLLYFYGVLLKIRQIANENEKQTNERNGDARTEL